MNKSLCLLTLTTVTCLASHKVAERSGHVANQALLRWRLVQAGTSLHQLHRGKLGFGLGVAVMSIPLALMGKKNQDLVKAQQAKKSPEPNYCWE